MPSAPSDSKPMQLARPLLATLTVGFTVKHLVLQSEIVQSREAWIAMMGTPKPMGALGFAVLGLFAVQVGLTLAPSAQARQATSQLWLERVLALLTLGFIGGHALHVFPVPGPHASAGDVYAGLSDALGRPVWLVAYVVGITATAGHLGLALLSFEPWVGQHDARRVLLVRGLSFLVAGGLWLGALSVLSWFAIGTSLF